MWNVVPVLIAESEAAYLLSLEELDLRKDSVRMEIAGSVLTVKAEMETVQQPFPDAASCFRSFSRSFNLPNNVNREGINVWYEINVLKLVLPKKTVKN